MTAMEKKLFVIENEEKKKIYISVFVNVKKASKRDL